MDFGKYAVIDNVTYNFEKEPELWWKFRPATVADEMEMQRWISNGSKQNIQPTWVDVAYKQIAMVSVATNIPGAGLEEGGSAIQFEELLKSAPIEMFGELWAALGDVNPLWGPPRPRPVETV